MRLHRSAILVLSGFCALTLFPMAESAVAAAAGLELVGPQQREARFIGRSAEVAVIVRNVSAESEPLTVRFVDQSGAGGGDLTASDGPGAAGVTLVRPSAAKTPLQPGATRRLVVRLRLLPGQAPRDAGGAIEISLGERPSVEVAIAGAPPDIRFDPPRVTIDVTQGCWVARGTCGDETAVLLRGRDARKWLLQREETRELGVAVLHNENGGTVTVRLKNPQGRGDLVWLTLDASDLNEAGRYSGSLPLDAAALSGRSLAVAVKVRWSLPAAIAAVFAGALLGGFFLTRFEIRRRRRLLELELRSALHRYDEERYRSGDRVFSYDLDAFLEPRRHDEADTLPFPGTRGVSALLWHIRTARDDDDFTEDTARAHELIRNIERWLKLEPVTRETTRLLEEERPPARDRGEFAECQAYRDLARLRVRARSVPPGDRACEEHVAALADQGLLVTRCKVVWALLAELESRSGWTIEQAAVIHDHDLLALEQRFPPRADRTPEQMDELRLLLDEAEERLKRLSIETTAAFAERPAVKQAKEIAEGLAETQRNPVIERTLPDVDPWRLRLNAMFNELALRSLLWTLGRALVAAAAYTLTVYSETWGSTTDFVSAVTVGFLSETLINWAVLPAFRSIRSRAVANSTEGGEGIGPDGQVPQSSVITAYLNPGRR